LWGGFGALALFAFLWRTRLSRRWSRKPYVIAKVHRLAQGVVGLTLDGPPMEFRAGQFVYLTPQDPTLPSGRAEEHPYAIVSAPHEPALRVDIKDLGDASHALLDVTPGSRALIEGPYGRFLPAQHRQPALWIGGGIGLTPFVSAARSFARAGGSVDVQLIYCANDPSRAYYREELQAIAAHQPGFSVHTHYFAELGPLSIEFLRSVVPDHARRAAYVCGPLPLLALVRRLLQESGVPRRRITTEEFNLL
jgi:predicted ferric reductase